jgi:hypothetical protein
MVAAFLAGGIAAVLCLVGFFFDQEQFFFGYLTGFWYIAGLSLGSMALLSLHHVTGGKWGDAIQPFAEAATMMVPVLFVLFLPVILGMRVLFPWADEAVVEESTIIQMKTWYLNEPFFLARAIVYFACWSGLAYLLIFRTRKNSDGSTILRQDIGAAGLIIYGLTVTFAAVDWGMSLEPKWFSSIYGAMFFVALIMHALVFLILCAWWREGLIGRGLAQASTRLDLGNLLLAFLVLWAYMNFIQYLVIWAGNMREDVGWYVHRSRGGWEKLVPLLFAVQFAAPFVLLLFRAFKRRRTAMAVLVAVIMITRLVDIYWLIMPAYYRGDFVFAWMGLLIPIALTLLFLGGFFWHFRKYGLRHMEPQESRHA